MPRGFLGTASLFFFAATPMDASLPDLGVRSEPRVVLERLA